MNSQTDRNRGPQRSDVRWQPLARVVAAGSLFSLTFLTLLVVNTGHLGGWDIHTQNRFSGTNPTTTAVATAVTSTASVAVMYPLLLLVGAAVAFRRQQWRPLVLAAAGAFLLGGTVHFGKIIVGRPRPTIAGQPFDPEFSFPSGHTAAAVVAIGIILVLLGDNWSTTRRRLFFVGYCAYVGLIGISRLVLQVHWLSDVIAGWLLGSLIVTTLALLYHAQPLQTGAALASNAGNKANMR